MKFLKPNPTQQDRIDAWTDFVDLRIDAYANMAKESPKNEMMFRKLLDCEIQGGGCPTCGVSWKEKIIDNRYILGKYYLPT